MLFYIFLFLLLVLGPSLKVLCITDTRVTVHACFSLFSASAVDVTAVQVALGKRALHNINIETYQPPSHEAYIGKPYRAGYLGFKL